MRPDGSNLERMTGDEGVNWFPHPSPDGKRVVYLAYGGAAGGHPANRDVELRMMPASGGKAEVLVSLFGGQGTINVPGWAPGSKRFTFVHHGK